MANRYKSGNYMNSGKSKSAYLASQAKPKVAAKPAAKSTSSKTPLVGYGPTLPGQTRASVYAGPTLQSTPGYYDYSNNSALPPQPTKSSSSSKSSSSKSSSPKTTNATAASLLPGGLFGTPSASASSSAPKKITSVPISTGSNATGNILTGIRQAASVIPGFGYLNSVGDLGLTELLGLSTKNQGLSSYADENGRLLDVPGQQIASSLAQDNGGVIPNNAAELFQQKQNEQAARSLINTSGFGAASQFANANNVFPTRLASNGRTPQPVTNPYTAPSTYIAPQEVQPVAPQPDFTPTTQTQPGTVQQFLGRGLLSNGAYNNGQGNYGIQGSLTGTSNDTLVQDLVNNILGVQTAQAAETPQTLNFGTNSISGTDLSNAFRSGGLTLDQGYSMPNLGTQTISPTNTAPQPRPRPTNPGGSQGGGVTQQYAQGATGGKPLENYYAKQEKGYSAAEKAQAKALKELIKSIKNQYKTQTDTGTQALEKSKQEDLLKLSGLFNFANQDPNSEQRIQYEQRANQDYANQLAQFLAQISQQQGQAISQAKQGYQSQLADIAQQRNATSLEIAKLQQAAQEAAMNRSSKGGVTTPTQPINYAGNDTQGRPVYWNTRTGQYQYAPEGVTRPQNSNDWLSALLGSGVAGMGGVQPTY